MHYVFCPRSYFIGLWAQAHMRRLQTVSAKVCERRQRRGTWQNFWYFIRILNTLQRDRSNRGWYVLVCNDIPGIRSVKIDSDFRVLISRLDLS